MKILVTGGAGFLGANLCRRLLADGHNVTCLDNLCSGREKNIKDLLSCPDFTFIRADVTEPFDIPCERIYALACPASPPFYQADPIGTAKTCFLGALNTLECARANHARVLLTSTSEVYGEPLVHPQTEDYRGNVNPHGIRSCYDEGKRIAECLFFDHQRLYGTDIRVVRLFNSYGPFMRPDDGPVISNLVCQALADKPLTVYGDGSQTRSFCYVDDTVEGIVRMMENDGFAGPVNIGNPAERTVREAAETILACTHSHSEVVFRPLPGDDPTRRRPDISLAKEKLSWEPQVAFAEGLAKTVAWFAKETGREG